MPSDVQQTVTGTCSRPQRAEHNTVGSLRGQTIGQLFSSLPAKRAFIM